MSKDIGVDVGVKATILKEKTVLNREKKSKLNSVRFVFEH
jgi:hypothetical protein